MVTGLYVWRSERYQEYADRPYHVCIYWANGKGLKRNISAERAYSLALLVNRLLSLRKVRLYPFCAEGCIGWGTSRIDNAY